MGIDVERLLVLKAFYMGHAIAEKRTSRPSALSMIGAAIEQLKTRQDARDQVRLAFYHMLRAEILRHEADPLPDRQEAQRICEAFGSPMYTFFMAVENATQSVKKLYGIQQLVIADTGIKRVHSEVVVSGWQAWVVRYDIALRVLGVSERDLSERDINFLEHVSLKALLDKHAIAYAP